MNTIGANIKQCRERANLSQQDLASKLCCGASKIEKYESGEQIPTTQTLLQISSVLEIPTSDLTN